MVFEPLVSIITIFLNEQRFLEEAIESVVRQTSDRWELLLVDDGSTDESSDIARRYAARDPHRIRYLTHSGRANRGKSASRNLGLHEARGKYVTFLDGDDLFKPEKVACQSAILTRQPVAMVYGRSFYWRSWPGASGSHVTDETSRLGVAPERMYAAPRLLAGFLRDGGTVPCISGLMARRRPALQVGGFDEEINDLFEDQVFIAKMCAHFPVYVEGGCWDVYRQHPASTSRQAMQAGLYHPVRPNESHRKFLIWLEGYIANAGVANVDLIKALAYATRPYRYPVAYAWRDEMRRLRKRAGRVMTLLRPR